ncbi:MAG: phosphoglucosamine mutase [Deferribacterota bacterium]|nr:phosphoglucosamine mutase [Deferribacterota bacterium]
MKRFFGTDGIRGKANKYPLTVDFVLKLGQASAKLFKNGNKEHYIVVGKDTRVSGYLFEYAIVSGICSMGINATLVGVMPTPAIAFLIRSLRADAGVVISASHNPYYDNGIKFFSSKGLKLSDALEEKIEDFILSNNLEVSDKSIGKAYRIETAIWRYVEYVKTTFDKDIDLKNIKIVVDCANGANYKIAPLAFSELGAKVIPINNNPDGYNINERCGSTFTDGLAKKVIEEKADLGISFDGDGDRVIFVDEYGSVINGDYILGICAIYLNEINALNNSAIVANVMSNMGLKLSLNNRGIKVISCPVGDRYVVETMLSNGIILGGEQSGHIVFLGHNSTGDGLISALQLLKVMIKKNKRLSELKKCINMLPQVQKNIKLEKEIAIEQLEKTKIALDKVRSDLGSKGRVLIRKSGTENALRLLLEGEDLNKISKLADYLIETVSRELVSI